MKKRKRSMNPLRETKCPLSLRENARLLKGLLLPSLSGQRLLTSKVKTASPIPRFRGLRLSHWKRRTSNNVAGVGYLTSRIVS